MVDAVNGVSRGMEVDVMRVSVSSSESVGAVGASDSVSGGDVRGISPRMASDPVSGVLVVEYLSSDGDVQRQLPSEATLAYLRSGLDEDGRVIKDPAALDAKTEGGQVLV